MSDYDKSRELFSKNLCYFLDINGKSQKNLAEYMGVSTGLVSDWCNSKKIPRVNKIKEICDWFHIEMSDLLTDKTKQQEEGYYLTEKTKRIAAKIYGNIDICELFEMCIEMEPKKLKTLLEFVKLSV